ncbi:MAG TPA: ATP-binding protein [Candidatus Methylomirabilis sp.]|nr:ATP-binding protein [Candidatus Methylomirabilis sp.]
MSWATQAHQRIRKLLGTPRGGAVAAGLLGLAVLLPIWWWAGRWYDARLRADEQGQVAADLSPLGNSLATAVNRRLARLDGLKAFVEAELASSKEVPEAQFRIFATGLLAGATGIRNLAVAPGGVVRHVYPQASNENVLGHDLLRDERPSVRADIQRAIQAGRITLSGPYELRQGGLGLVARHAITLNGSFWGLVTMVVDVPPLLKDAGLQTHPLGLVLALRDPAGQVFHGQPAVFASMPVSQRVLLPDGWWELAGIPAAGWDGAARHSLLVFHGIGLAVILLLVSLISQSVNRTARLRAAVRERTEGLERELAERRQMEEALGVSQAYFSNIVEISEDAIISIDPGHRITLFNLGAEKIFGYRAADVLGKPVEMLIPRRFMESHARHVESFASSPDILRPMNERGVVFGRREDGTEFPAEASISKFEVKGERVLTVRLRDITERKRMEAQIRQSQKMEAIGTLAGGIAHDFNNLLAAIIGHAELVTDNVPRDGTAWQDLQHVLAAGKRAKDLVRQILTFSRQTEQERRPVSVSMIANEALRLLRASLPATIEIRQHIDPEAGDVLADASQIHQILMNLCTNAEHAMRERGGVLDVNVKGVAVDRSFASSHPPLRPGPHVRLTIRDTGQGMPPHVRERIFEPFFTTKGPGEGTGMGLAVVHGIVAGHRGAISVDTAPERGTKFEIYLPRCDAAEAVDAPAEEPLHGGRERILIVDDEPFLARLWREMLQRLGYQVTGFTDSFEALETFRATPESFDLVMTDQTMPQLTGETLARECLRIRPDIPIILCTGFSHTMTEEKARALGIRAYLMKPLSRRELGLAVRCVLDQQVPAEVQAVPGLTILSD